jgi:hypothetical protein
VSFYQETILVVIMPVEPSTHSDSSTLSNTSVLELPESMSAHEDTARYVDMQIIFCEVVAHSVSLSIYT